MKQTTIQITLTKGNLHAKVDVDQPIVVAAMVQKGWQLPTGVELIVKEAEPSQ